MPKGLKLQNFSGLINGGNRRSTFSSYGEKQSVVKVGGSYC